MLRVATYNVHDCVGRDGRYAPERIAAIIADLRADIVALQEITLDAQGAVVAALERLTRLRTIDGTLFARRGGRYGNIVMSRLPVLERCRLDLSIPGREPRGLLELQVAGIGGRAIRILATHLGLGSDERARQIEALARRVATVSEPLILLGDFNVWQGPGKLRPLLRAGLQCTAVRTFPTWVRPVLALDRILVRAPARIHACWRAHVAATAVASDHYPLVAEIAFDDLAGPVQTDANAPLAQAHPG
ncbi:MAG: endonuclease/exonuclease/phosphatase family protein [Burkholderiaceae bacterium]